MLFRSGDVFIGCSKNFIFGKARSINISKDVNGKFSIVRSDVFSTSSDFGTSFIYTENYIENILIPNLYLLRDALLKTVSSNEYNLDYPADEEKIRYITTLTPYDARFGSSNIDAEVWGKDANTDNNKNNFYGPSYIMILPKILKNDDAYIDQVLWYNEQISLWERTLAANEKAKVEAIENPSKYFDVNYSFDSGAVLEASTTLCYSETNVEEKTFELLGVIGANASIDTRSGVGVAVSLRTETGGRTTSSSLDGLEFCFTTGYALVEDGDDDALTVDVYNAPDGFGAIFRTRGGQTCCPYEDAVYTKYYKPGTEISAATMKIEIPSIYVVNSFATDIPAGKSANFELKLDNLSETDEDVWFELAIDRKSVV